MIAKPKKQKTKEEINKEMEKALKACDFTHHIITDNPLHQAVNIVIKESDVHFLCLKECEDGDKEPRYWVWKGIDYYKGVGADKKAADTCMHECEDCFLDA